MSAPRTLRELRAAVARVLVARGEAADALRVDCVDRRGGRYPADMRWFAEIGGNYCGTRPFMLAFGRGADEASACDAAWRSFAEQREAAVVAAQAALAAAQDEVLRARAALDAAEALAASRGAVAGTGRAAEDLRAVMDAVWKAMEGGR